MPVRTSNPLFLEVLTGTPSLGVPIEFDVYDGQAPATMLATLENAFDRSFTDVLGDLGAGTFKISRHDPKNTPTIIRRGNIVKCRVAGIYRFAFLIDDIADVPLSPNEGAGEVLSVSGRGVSALLDRAIVYPPVYPPATIGMVGTSQVANSVATTIVVTRPTGTKVGDLLLYGIAVTGGSSANITPPAGRGWVQVRKDSAGTSLALFVFRRRVTATTNQSSDTFTIDTSRQANAVAYSWRGVSVNDLDMADAGQNNGSSVNITAPEVIPSLVNSVACAFFATAVNTSVTPPTGYAEQRDLNTTGVTIEESTRALGSSLATTGPVVAVAVNAAVNCGAQVLMAPSAESAASYIGLTWGAILDDQLTEAQSRGGLPQLTWDFTAALDSMGAPWADTPQIVFPAGTPLLEVYQQAIGMGLDAQVTTDLVVQLYEEYARHKESTVVFRGGYHLTDTVEKRLTEHGLKTRLLVEGAGGLFFEVSDPVLEGDPKIGRREGFLSFTTAVDPTTMQRGGEATLASLAAEAEALSIPVRHGTGSGQFEPFVDYRKGDWITLDVPGTYDLAAFRIEAITLQDAEGPDFDCTLDLNSVSLEYLTRLKRQLDQMGNPSSGSGTQSGFLASSPGGGATASTGQVASTVGDAPGFLFDKVAVGGGITKGLVGVAPNQQLKLTGATPVLTLDGLTDVDTSTVPPTNGQALVYDLASTLWKPGSVASGGGGSSTAFIGCRVSRSATQSIAINTWVPIDFTAADTFDSDNFHDPASNPSRVTIPAGMGGKYLAIGFVGWAVNATGSRYNAFAVNGTRITNLPTVQQGAITGNGVVVSDVISVAAGDYVELHVNQDATTLNVAGAYFDLVKLDSGKVGSGIGARVTKTTTQTVTSGVELTVLFDAEDFDTDGFHSTVTNTERLTIPPGLGGKYLVVGNVSISGGAGGNIREIALYKNASVTTVADWIFPPNGNGFSRFSGSQILDLVPGDYVVMKASQDSGGNRTIDAGYPTNFSIMRLDSGSSGSGAGTEIDYAEITAPVNISAGTAAGADIVVTGGTKTYDGSPVLVTFSASWHRMGSGGNPMVMLLFMDGTLLAEMGRNYNPFDTFEATMRLTPSAGSHQFSWRAYFTFANTGTRTVEAGAGTAGAYRPAYLRVTKV